MAEECDKSTPVETGSVAGCDGLLVPGTWIEECIHLKEVELPKLGVDYVACKDELEVTQEFYGAFRIQCETHVAELEDLVRKAARIERPWYESNLLWGIGGIVLGAAGTYVLVTKW